MSKEETNIDKSLRNTEFVAKFFGRTTRHVQQLTTDGILPVVKKTHKEGNLYDLIPTIQRYIKYLQGIVDNRTKSTEEQEKQRLDAEIKLKEAKAEIAQLDLKELKAEMLRAEDVQAFIEDLAATTKSLLMGLPGRLAMDLESTTTAAERAEIIEGALFEVLDLLSEYKFSVEYYKRRVAERTGRSVSNDDEAIEE